MHFHLPKPQHGWRAFAGEVGIIVIGVLIALGAEQVVQWSHERAEVAQLRGALNGELADDRARWEDLRAGDACMIKRLVVLDQWLAKAPSNARLENALTRVFWNMHSSAWDIAKASPVSAKIPLKQRLTYASLYAAIDSWREQILSESANAQQIEALFATADRPDSRREIPRLLAMSREKLKLRQRNYPYFFTRFDELGIRPDPSQLTVARDPNELCRPLESAG